MSPCSYDMRQDHDLLSIIILYTFIITHLIHVLSILDNTNIQSLHVCFCDVVHSLRQEQSFVPKQYGAMLCDWVPGGYHKSEIRTGQKMRNIPAKSLT